MLDKIYFDILDASMEEHKSLLKYKSELESASKAFDEHVINMMFEAGELDAMKQGQIDPASQEVIGQAAKQEKPAEPKSKMRTQSPEETKIANDPRVRNAGEWMAGQVFTRHLVNFLVENAKNLDNIKFEKGKLPDDFRMNKITPASNNKDKSADVIASMDSYGQYTNNNHFSSKNEELNKNPELSFDKIFHSLTYGANKGVPFIGPVYSMLNDIDDPEKKLQFLKDLWGALQGIVSFEEDRVYFYIENFLQHSLMAAQVVNYQMAPVSDLEARGKIWDAIKTMFPKVDVNRLKQIQVPQNAISIKQAWDNLRSAELTQPIVNNIKTALEAVAPEIDKKINNIIKKMSGSEVFNVQQEPAVKPETPAKEPTVPTNASYEDELYNNAKKYLESYRQYSSDEILRAFNEENKIATPEQKAPITNAPAQKIEVEAKPTDPKTVIKSKPVADVAKTIFNPKDTNQRNEAIRYVTGFVALYAIGVYLQSINQYMPTNEEYTEGIVGKVVKGALGHIGGAALGLIKQFASGMPVGVTKLVQGDFNKFIELFVKHSDTGGGFADAMNKMGMENLTYGLNGDVFTKQNLKDMGPQFNEAMNNAKITLEKELGKISEQQLETLIKQFYEPKTAYAKGAKLAEKTYGALQKLRW